MNIVTLLGRLTKEPEMRTTQSGTSAVSFTLAVDRGLSKEKRQEAEANNQPTADFINCKAYGNTADLITKYFRKGNRMGVEGKIQTGSYEKDGRRIYTTDVIVNRVHFIESGQQNQQQSNQQQAPQQYQQQGNQPQGNQQQFAPLDGNAGYYPIQDEYIPF